MSKDRLTAFIDAVLAIVMTILVLELEAYGGKLGGTLGAAAELSCVYDLVLLARSSVEKSP